MFLHTHLEVTARLYPYGKLALRGVLVRAEKMVRENPAEAQKLVRILQ